MAERPYTKTPNEILESQHLMSESEFRVTMALIRLTHGYHRAECKVTYDELQDMTGLSRGGVSSGVAASGARGFFERIGRSGWRSLVYSIDYSEQSNGLTSRPKQSTSHTKNSLTGRPNEGNTLYKKNKRNIYTNGLPPSQLPAEAEPFPDHNDLRQEMVSAIAGEVKTVYAIGVNSDDFERIADGILEKGIEPGQVEGFYEKYWKANGHYKGKPALKSLLGEIDNYAGNNETENPTAWIDDIELEYTEDFSL